MIQPQSFDVTRGEFSEDVKAWAIQGKSGRFLAIPDSRFPGRKPIRFFASQYDAERVIKVVLDVKPVLEAQNLVPIEVHLLKALRDAAAANQLGHADSFVLLSIAEVYEFILQLKQKPVNQAG